MAHMKTIVSAFVFAGLMAGTSYALACEGEHHKAEGGTTAGPEQKKQAQKPKKDEPKAAENKAKDAEKSKPQG